MKNFTLLVLLLATVSIAGCKKDDEEKQQKDIVGKWFVKQTVEKEIESGVTTFEETETNFTAADFFEFKSDGSLVNSIQGDAYRGTYEVKASNRLVMTDEDGDTEDFEIKKLNSSELIIYIEDIDGPNAKETFEVTLRK